MSGRYGSLPDPGGKNAPKREDTREDERSYPLYKAFEEFVRRSFENGTTNASVYCTKYDECAHGISVTLSAVQKAGKEFRDTLQSFSGSPQVELDTEFDESQGRDVHSVFLEWPAHRNSVSRMFSSGNPKRRGKLYDQPKVIILAMAATLLVATLSTSPEQWLLLGSKVGLL